MREEFRFFLRIALYMLIAGGIYVGLTYEWAGSILMLAMVVALVGFVIAAGAGTKLFTRRLTPNDLIGFSEADDALEIEDEAISPGSIWPLMAAVAMLMLALGFLYGGWFWLPGASLAALSAWMWLTELVR